MMCRPLLLAALAGLALSVPAHATILSWNNAAGGTFGTAANWNPVQVPTTADSLQYNLLNTYTVNFTSGLTTSGGHTFKRGNVTLNVSSPHSTSSIFRVADAATDNAVVTLTTGNFTVNNAVFIGNASGSLGTLNVNDADANFVMGLSTGLVAVGLGSTGAINLTNGGELDSAADIIVGNNAVSSGSVLVSGINANSVRSFLRTTGTGDNMTIGLSGDGQLDIAAGGLVSLGGSAIIANSTGSTGTVSITGQPTVGTPSTLEAIDTDSDITVGLLGTGTLTIADGGRLYANRDLLIAPQNGGTGSLTVGGTASHIARIIVGRNLGVGYNDGEQAGIGGNGSLIINANAVVQVLNITEIGDPSGLNTSLLRINGGQLNTVSLYFDEFNVFNTTFDFRDGSVIIDGGSIFYSSAPSFGRDFAFGHATGHPSLTLQGGGHTSLETFDIGDNTGNAAVVVTGAGTSLSATSGTFPQLLIDSPVGTTGSLSVEAGATVNAERLSVRGGAGTNSLTVSGASFINTTTLEVTGAGASLTAGGIGTHITTTNFRLGTISTPGGVVTLNAGCDMLVTSTSTSGTFALDLVDSSTLNLAAGAQITTAGGLKTTGTLNVTGGTINAITVTASKFSTGLTSGTINAFGSLNADIAILDAASTLTATGALTMGRATSPTGFANTAGTFIVPAAGAATILDSNAADLGNTQMTTPGIIHAANGVTIASGKTLSGSGTVDAAVQNLGTINATGALTLGNAASATGFVNSGLLTTASAAVVTLLDSGVVDLGNVTMNTGRIATSHGSSIASGRTVSGVGQIDGALQNLGTITPTGTGLTFTGALTGVGQGIAGTAMRFNTGGSFTGAGTINADVITDATGTVTATGNLTIGRDTSSTGVSIGGSLFVGANAVTFRDSTAAQLGVLTELRGGLIIAPAGGTSLTGGTTPDLLRGVGTHTGNLVSAGRIQVGLPAPSSPVGVLAINGTYTQSSTGSLELEIRGAATGDRDILAVSGAATLAGTLTVTTLNGFAPPPGSTFRIMTYASHTGSFTTVNAPGFDVVYAATGVDLVVPNVCDPDLNQDGNADQDDVAYLVNVIAGGDNPTGIDPDFNHDGNVDQEDYVSIVGVVAGGPCP